MPFAWFSFWPIVTCCWTFSSFSIYFGVSLLSRLFLSPNVLSLSPPHHSHQLNEPKYQFHSLFHRVFCTNDPFSFLPLSPLFQYSPFFSAFFSAAYRRIYPPDDKLLLEKYESLLSAAFQTFLAGRAASLQKEMNNPLKRMKARTSMTHTYFSLKRAERETNACQNIHKDMHTCTLLWKRKHTFLLRFHPQWQKISKIMYVASLRP